MGCCDDPTEPSKAGSRDVARAQAQYGNLVRDLFTEDPEKVMLRQLHEANNYLKELAALRAHYASVRLQAIGLLDKNSLTVLEQIIDKEPDTEFGQAAQKRLDHFNNATGFLPKFFHS
ncbi:MAG: hypothetical protein ACU83N_13040 [Gammaproteobacteria bacterium]